MSTGWRLRRLALIFVAMAGAACTAWPEPPPVAPLATAMPNMPSPLRPSGLDFDPATVHAGLPFVLRIPPKDRFEPWYQDMLKRAAAEWNTALGEQVFTVDEGTGDTTWRRDGKLVMVYFISRDSLPGILTYLNSFNRVAGVTWEASAEGAGIEQVGYTLRPNVFDVHPGAYLVAIFDDGGGVYRYIPHTPLTQAYYQTTLHELGHVLGLGHSANPGDVMAAIGFDPKLEPVPSPSPSALDKVFTGFTFMHDHLTINDVDAAKQSLAAIKQVIAGASPRP